MGGSVSKINKECFLRPNCGFAIQPRNCSWFSSGWWQYSRSSQDTRKRKLSATPNEINSSLDVWSLQFYHTINQCFLENIHKMLPHLHLSKIVFTAIEIRHKVKEERPKGRWEKEGWSCQRESCKEQEKGQERGELVWLGLWQRQLRQFIKRGPTSQDRHSKESQSWVKC